MCIDRDKVISELIMRLEKLEGRIRGLESLEKENEALRGRLAKYEIPKNGRNSSLPPSRDMGRAKKNQSLRKRT